MKSMSNELGAKNHTLKEKFLCKIGCMIAQYAVNPRHCWIGLLYEKEIAPELISEVTENKSQEK